MRVEVSEPAMSFSAQIYKPISLSREVTMMRSQRIGWLIGTLIVALLVSNSEANAGMPTATWSGLQDHEIRVATDSSLFAAAIRWMKADHTTSGRKKRPLHVDPRPLRPGVGEVRSLERYFAAVDSSARHRRRVIRQRLEASTIRKRDFAEVDFSLLRRRRTILRRLGVPQRDALTYADECLFACDPRLIKKDEADRIECPKERCEVTVVALSLPISPETESHREEQNQKTVRVLQLTPFTRFIHELTFQRSDRGWTMIEKEVVTGGGM